MRVGVKPLTCPLLYEELPEFFTFQVMKTSPLTLLPHAPQLPVSHIKSLYAAGYHSVALTMKNVPQFTFHLITAPYYLRTPMGFAQLSLSKSIYTICDDSEKEEEDFQTVTLDDNHWITDPVPDGHLCIHEHSQPHSLCPYPFPCSTDSTPVSYQDTLDLSDISKFEDVMTTSSDKDIPALDDVIGL